MCTSDCACRHKQYTHTGMRRYMKYPACRMLRLLIFKQYRYDDKRKHVQNNITIMPTSLDKTKQEPHITAGLCLFFIQSVKCAIFICDIVW